MSYPSRRIIDSSSRARPYAAWLSGLAAAVLSIGTYGALQPLLPPVERVFVSGDDNIEVMDFLPPAEAPAESQADETAEQPPEPEVEIAIPPLPEITPPLTPPEVPELVALDKPPPPPTPPKAPERNKQPEAKPAPRRASQTAGNSTSSGTASSPTLFTGGGGGRFPQPSYPASARSARVQGMVRLMITVEASGVPSSVDIQSSSGSAALDSAAADCLRRRWRWPSGPVRRYIVPVLFQLR
ncbi:MAG: TonB family protein [Verrucomicrobiaceae bacterium]|nr:TonB family protein [Verrucomicrobiaceae bacterium]MDB6120191.1 TonB family protein [Verrucomicrobiaceae bacterium]